MVILKANYHRMLQLGEIKKQHILMTKCHDTEFTLWCMTAYKVQTCDVMPFSSRGSRISYCTEPLLYAVDNEDC